MIVDQNISKAKLDVRQCSRDLIKVIFEITKFFPKSDPHHMSAELRKKVLSTSSYISHGTVESDIEEQGEKFLYVMGELREILKFVTVAHHLKYMSDAQKSLIRLAISDTINSLDNLVKLLGNFNQ